MSNQYAQGVFGNHNLGIIRRPEACSSTEPLDNSPILPFHHSRQSEFDSCAIVAVRDLFSFYGLHQDALQLEKPMRKMLSNILETGLQGVDVDKMNRAFSTFPPQSQGTFRIEEVLKNAHQTKSLKGLVNPQKKVFSTPSVLLFLSECGLEPKTVVLTEPAGRFEALTALNNGQPIFICEDEAKPLIARIQKKNAPLTGHMFMLLKNGRDPNIYLYDINSKVPIPVPMTNLQETFNHPKSRAIIPQRVPPTIPPHLQGGLTVELPV